MKTHRDQIHPNLFSQCKISKESHFIETFYHVDLIYIFSLRNPIKWSVSNKLCFGMMYIASFKYLSTLNDF